jgi:hypothetical protein
VLRFKQLEDRTHLLEVQHKARAETLDEQRRMLEELRSLRGGAQDPTATITLVRPHTVVAYGRMHVA